MSIISSIPVLQGRDGVVLSAVSEGLVLERPRQVLTIPSQAVARVHTEGRTLSVELRAPVGSTPAVYRIEDVSEAAATAFASGVNSLLAEPDEEVDGAALVVVQTLKTLWRVKFLRRLKWFVLGCVGTVVALGVIAGIVGDAGYVIIFVPFGFITVAALGAGAYAVGTWNHERRLLKHGVTVFARPADQPGAYLYTDTAGMTRGVTHMSSAPYVQVSFDPQDPADVLVPPAPFMRRFSVTLGAFILFCGLNGMTLLVFLVADALSGGALMDGM
ncbi:hypothetical protein GCM10009730_50080 [Streptomyces albidochromogenes]|uniref:hypothetical protein n=1 Tax=Streptomyces albidochromogenes TaxID=329524 RepID=UPI00110FBA87|nr:hypothetical protein [Streptomyces albidochromogenes]